MPKTMAERFEAQRREIARCFFDGVDPGEITSVSQTGDRHLHGEAVARLTTAAGVLYYKPRSGAATELLGEINALLFDERMVPEQLGGEDYAFQKAVTVKVPAAGAERRAFYTRMGRLAAVFFALGSTDMHRDNVVPLGGSPCVIDTETLLCARAEGFGGAGDFSADYGQAFPELSLSAGESMVLPRFYGRFQRSPLLLPDGSGPAGYEDAFLAGFRDGYRAIQENREAIFALLDRRARFPIRYLIRSTAAYGAILSAYTAALSEEARKLALSRLAKGLDDEQKCRWRSILSWEADCIREGDIPYFWLYADERALRGDRTGCCLIEDFLGMSPVEYAKDRIQRMDGDDLAVQCAYIRAALGHMDDWSDPTARYFRPAVQVPERLPEPLSREAALREVSEALHQLWGERIPTRNGRCLWHVPLIDGKPLSLYGLTAGFSGIGVFCRDCRESPLLSEADRAMAREASDACWQDMLKLGRYLLNEYPAPPAERLISRRFEGGFGFPDGLAGFLWALERCRDGEDRESGEILSALSHWGVGETSEAALGTLLSAPAQPWPDTDVLDRGLAGRAWAFLLSFERGEAGALLDAGRLLAWMVERKQENGCFQVFREGRKQYFLPGFLRGSAGIAWVLLRYAELMRN